MPFKFIYFCDLLDKLEATELHDPPLLRSVRAKLHLDTINQWFRSHRRIIDAAATDRAALLSSFLPERRTDRVYNLQEPGLTRVLGRCLGLGRDRLAKLSAWKPSNHVDLATWVADIQRQTDAGMSQCSVSVEEVDLALARLAACSRFSGPKVRGKDPGGDRTLPEDALKPLLHKLPSRELKWFVRLVLKKFGQVSLDEQLILRNVHALLPEVLKFQADFDAACELLKNPKLAGLSSRPDQQYETMLHELAAQCLNPKLGVKIGRPEFIKARSIKHCLQITGRGKWNIEPKYDGEYCQVHIDLEKRDNMIQIFSKSGKDSTQDKIKLHKWIRKCLQIGTPECKFQKRCILEGEMVVFSDKDQAILEFCKIRKHVPRSGTYLGTEADSQAHAHEHLEIVFFDALLIDDEIVMSQKYELRRQRLKDILVKFAGRAQTGSWGTVDFGKLSPAKAVDKVERAFAKAIAQRCEGLILKPCDGPYFSLGKRKAGCHDGKVIKLKKDYIPGLGDTADFAIVGASFVAADAQAWGEKNVRYTHFVLACLENKEDVLRYQSRPILRVMGSLSRPCIPVPIIQQISSYGKFQEELFDQSTKLPSNYNLLFTGGPTPMAVAFRVPFIIEVMGAGFDKPSSQNFYMLRHPRILKIHRDRLWEDVVSFADLQTMAKKAVSLPDDLIEEQREWLFRLHKAGTPSNAQYLTTVSPFSDRATTVTTSQSSVVTTPAKTKYKLPAMPLVRMDSSELLSGEERIGPDTTTPVSSAIIKENTMHPRVPASSIPALTTTTDTTSGFSVQHHQVSNLATAEAKRKHLDVDDEAVCKEPSSKRLCDGDQSSTKPPPVEASERPIAVSVSSDNSRSPGDPIFFTPLDEIRNGTSLRRSPRLHSSCQGKSLATQTEVRKVGSQSPVLLPAQAHVEAILDKLRPSSFKRTVDPAVSSPLSAGREVFLTAPNTPHCSQVSNIFMKHTFYLSPCVAAFPLLTQDFLPLLKTQHTTNSLAHWRRDLQRPDQASLGPVVGESQACPGLQKAVLVESRRIKPTEQVVASLLQLNLAKDERVEIWDWRVVEELLELQCGGLGQDAIWENAERSLKKWFVGCVVRDEYTNKTASRIAAQEAKNLFVRGLIGHRRGI